MQRLFLNIVLLLGSLSSVAQEKNFVVSGNLPLPDDYHVSIICQTDTNFSVEMATTTMRGGAFELRGSIDRPLHGTLMTNNLQLVERNNWPTDSIHWTYSDVFLSAGRLTVIPNPYDKESPLQLVGTQVQTDYNSYRSYPAKGGKDLQFIVSHPHSAVSVWLANNMLKRGYRMSANELATLENALTSVPDDPKALASFRATLPSARLTTRGSALVDLDILDTKNKPTTLNAVVPGGKYVLVDFWASWCGICLYSMPEIERIAADFSDFFSVVGVSVDTKDAAWRSALKKHPHKWAQYRTTEQGYKDMFSKYNVGNGVPYYLLISPEGKVLCSPSGPDELRQLLTDIKNKK